MLHLVLYIIALICFLLAAFGVVVSKINLVALGLALCTLTLII